MTDVELSSLLSDLRDSANNLNSETSGVNAVINSVESQLVGMNLGLECWLEINAIDSKNLSKDSCVETQLGFAKVAGEWCLSIRDTRHDFDKQVDEWVRIAATAPAKLQDASRDVRIKALKLLPELLSALKERADSDTQVILGAKKLLGW